MAFTFAALSYIVALIVDAFLIFFAIFHVSAVLCVPCHAWVSACPGVMAHQRGVAAAGGPGGGRSPARGASATGPGSRWPGREHTRGAAVLCHHRSSSSSDDGTFLLVVIMVSNEFDLFFLLITIVFLVPFLPSKS